MKIKELSDKFNIYIIKLRHYKKIRLFDDVRRVKLNFVFYKH